MNKETYIKDVDRTLLREIKKAGSEQEQLARIDKILHKIYKYAYDQGYEEGIDAERTDQAGEPTPWEDLD